MTPRSIAFAVDRLSRADIQTNLLGDSTAIAVRSQSQGCPRSRQTTASLYAPAMLAAGEDIGRRIRLQPESLAVGGLQRDIADRLVALSVIARHQPHLCSLSSEPPLHMRRSNAGG